MRCRRGRWIWRWRGWRVEAGGVTGGWRPATCGWRLVAGGWRPVVGRGWPVADGW
ncbi:phosphotransferase [Streptomyces sp. CMB-StM0423]|nr:phosphotransferase [Streptomyces sp. CMB-StM0423]